MGGKEALRGFLYQGFAAVLEALTQNSWDKIYVEYPSKEDKVDIALECEGNIIKSIQVKSSINLFTKTNTIKWIENLTSDIKAETYEILLIGQCEKAANDFINSIEKYKNSCMDQKAENAIKGFNKVILDENVVQIRILPMEQNYLNSIVRDALNKYISFKGYSISFDSLELLAESALSTQMLLGTKGDSISKIDFDEKIFKWIELTSGGLKNISFTANHKLSFYDFEKKTFESSLKGKSIFEFYNSKKYIESLKKQCLNLVCEIGKIKLNTYEKLPSEIKENVLLDGIKAPIENINDSQFDFSGLFNTYAELKDDSKTERIQKIKNFLGVDVDNEFFYVGNLKKEKKFQLFNQYSYEYHGTEDEKKKDCMISELQHKLFLYELTVKFLNNFNGCVILPIAICNIGEVADKDITIQVMIDRSKAKLFNITEYLIDDYIRALLELFCGEDNIVENTLKIHSDENVSVEYDRFYNVERPLHDVQYKIEDFYSELEKYIADVAYTNDQYYVIEFSIDSIRPKENKYLNKLVLLTKAQEQNDIEINYSILSTSSNGLVKGILNVE